MKIGHRISLLILLPAMLVMLVGLVLSGWFLHSLQSRYEAQAHSQAQDLETLRMAADFNRQVGLIHGRASQALDQARSGELDELSLYRVHASIVNELQPVTNLVQLLATSELLLDVNHNSAKGMEEQYASYRSMVIMATEIAAVDPTTASRHFDIAQQNFTEFTIFANRIAGLLTERALLRNSDAFSSLNSFFKQLVVFGLLSAFIVLVLAWAAGQLLSRRMRVIADALKSLAHEQVERVTLPEIEQMRTQGTGELRDIAGALLLFREAIAKRKLAEEQAHQLAYYDSLTSLPNRRLLGDRLEHACAVSAINGDHGAVLWLDLDRFKVINDSRGHAAGDSLLREVSARLQRLLKRGETVARIGGDEFVIVLESIEGGVSDVLLAVDERANRIRETLSLPYEVGGGSHFSTPSIGVALFCGDDETVERLLMHAETAMYQAKDAGRNAISFYDPGMQAQVEARAVLESELRTALEQRQLELFYQPQVNAVSEVVGVEALIRWRHPEHGLVSPADFIPLAEETGLILPMGLWVIETACDQLAVWQDKSFESTLTIAVNVSGSQFRQDRFVQQMEEILFRTGAEPSRLKLELTESIVLENIESTVRKMRQLKALGVRFALDDFGTGYSSLQYLKRLPLDQLKIDQSFVRDLVEDPDDRVIVNAIIAMGQALGLEVIAEGVETSEQQLILAASGCDLYQGYLYSRPLPLADLQSVLNSYSKGVAHKVQLGH
ncbi:putative bifunctional diguanylate cyclase/phosphodiesterase [Nitrincola alkalilacustris]|uniref:putative bifunctional diguanylate cyclase/phosphodiesterase n=1 Tax=Nitrincola alkalilacustris TaxID=1571224 RepID=UPI00124ED245|nr:EAL domain-containing protein [Nitrincola alkalilacustris]